MSNESKLSATTRTIALEEHFATPVFLEGPGRWHKEAQPSKTLDQLCDLGDRRIADMDAAGIDVQVLSLVDAVETVDGTSLAEETHVVARDRRPRVLFAAVARSVADDV